MCVCGEKYRIRSIYRVFDNGSPRRSKKGGNILFLFYIILTSNLVSTSRDLHRKIVNYFRVFYLYFICFFSSEVFAFFLFILAVIKFLAHAI